MKKLILNLFSKDKNLFLFIFISGLLLRSITAFFFGDRILENEWNILVKNLYFYDSFSLLVFDDLFVPNLWMPPLYGYFIYLHSLLVGFNEYLPISVITSQIIIASITPVFFFKIISIFFNRKLSIIGSFTFNFFPLIIFSSSQISSVTIFLFLNILFFYFILKLKNNSKIKLILIIGILSSLLILTRRDFVLIYLFSLLYIFLFLKINIKTIVTIIIITIIGISPYLYRNYVAFDKFIIHSGFGYNLWKAYNPNANVEGYLFVSEELQSKINTVEKNIYYRINEDQIYLEQALTYIKNDPQKYINLYFKRLYSFYFFDLNSSQKNYYNPVHIYPIILVSLLSICGLFTFNKKNNKLNYLVLTFLLLVVLYAFFAVLPRYKIYILPFQIILSVSYLKYLFEKLRIKN
tara:strand:+ start:30 stop:1250 length:1221 start_codon:yes stop_codon:yes gene_type:complete